jgi:hypothetical protein
MEPTGRNPWQPVANGTAARTAQTGETVAAACDRLPETFHGKEGVDGSSPSEVFEEKPCKWALCVACTGEIRLSRGYP